MLVLVVIAEDIHGARCEMYYPKQSPINQDGLFIRKFLEYKEFNAVKIVEKKVEDKYVYAKAH